MPAASASRQMLLSLLAHSIGVLAVIARRHIDKPQTVCRIMKQSIAIVGKWRLVSSGEQPPCQVVGTDSRRHALF
jgi:hypothetical protein